MINNNKLSIHCTAPNPLKGAIPTYWGNSPLSGRAVMF